MTDTDNNNLNKLTEQHVAALKLLLEQKERIDRLEKLAETQGSLILKLRDSLSKTIDSIQALRGALKESVEATMVLNESVLTIEKRNLQFDDNKP